MTHSIAATGLLRQVLADAATAPTPLVADDRTRMFDAAMAQLRYHPELAIGTTQAITYLQRMLHAERLGHAMVERQLAETQALLAATQAALAVSRHLERQARHSALHDSLTSLPNRAFFRNRLDEALRLNGPECALAVLVLDLDGFKPVNDTHGHAIGDELLKVIAARLSRSVRESDWVGRLGGDEFACVLTGVPGRERLQSLAGALHDAISAPIALGALRLRVRSSIGIAVHDGIADGDTLIRRADAAMFAAKRSRAGLSFCEAEEG